MWFAFIPVPVINGALREGWYKARVGEFGSNIIGFVVLSSVFLLYTYLFFKNQIGELSTGRLFLMGGIWLGLTLVFEFGIGLAGGRSWSYMLADYNILKGKLWPFILTVIFFAPQIIKRMLK
jgi:hypothetical protein